MTTLTCPSCHSNLLGPAIPVHSRDHYPAGLTHFSRLMAEYCRDRDMTIAYSCPDCGYRNTSRKVFDGEVK